MFTSSNGINHYGGVYGFVNEQAARDYCKLKGIDPKWIGSYNQRGFSHALPDWTVDRAMGVVYPESMGR
jgi:hypothetical protein